MKVLNRKLKYCIKNKRTKNCKLEEKNYMGKFIVSLTEFPWVSDIFMGEKSIFLGEKFRI